MTATCPHPDFAAFVDVARFVPDGVEPSMSEPAVGFAATIRVDCTLCGQQMRVLDPELPVGLLPGRVTVGVDARELRVPLWPDDGTDPPQGQLAGFTVRIR